MGICRRRRAKSIRWVSLGGSLRHSQGPYRAGIGSYKGLRYPNILEEDRRPNDAYLGAWHCPFASWVPWHSAPPPPSPPVRGAQGHTTSPSLPCLLEDMASVLKPTRTYLHSRHSAQPWWSSRALPPQSPKFEALLGVGTAQKGRSKGKRNVPRWCPGKCAGEGSPRGGVGSSSAGGAVLVLWYIKVNRTRRAQPSSRGDRRIISPT